jgi:tetratricopeptide (TPR) repeat protein
MLRKIGRYRWLVGASLILSVSCSKKAPADHVRSAAGFEAKKDYANAILEYRAALQSDPKLGDARLKLGDIYAQLGDAQNAYREYVRAADTMPDSADAQLKAGALLLLGNQFADAKVRAENVLRRNPRDPGALTLLGNALAGLNDMDGAFDRLNAAIQVDPGQGSLYSNLGVLQLARGDRQLAEASFKKAIRATPDRAETRVALAHFYRSQGRNDEAETILKEALAINPASIQVNSNLAELFIQRERPLEAEAPLKAIAEARQDAASKFALADYYTGTNRARRAAAILDSLAATKETYALAKARLAAIDYTEGRAAEAHAILDELLKREPHSRIGLLLKARLLLLEKKPDEALAMAKGAAAADPERAADAFLVVAQSYFAKGQIEDAQDAIKQVIKLDPRSVAAQLLQSRLYAAKGDKQPAVDFAQQAVVLAPRDSDARLSLIRAVLANGDTVRAEKEIRTLLLEFPNSSGVNAQAGALFLARHNLAAARTAFARSLELDAASADGLAGLVTLDLGAKESAAAVRRIEARLAAAPEDARAWFLAARTYAVVGNAAQTERALLKTLELDPANVRAFAMVGDLYGIKGDLARAVAQFQAWAAREPRSIAAHTMVALLLERLNRLDEAKSAYERVLDLNPHAAVAANNLAWITAEQGGNLDQATDLAQMAKSQAPDQPAFNDTLGWIYFKKNLAQESVPLFRQSLEKDPENALTNYHLGMAYAKLGEDSKAITSLKRALSLDPNLSAAADARRALAELQVP